MTDIFDLQKIITFVKTGFFAIFVVKTNMYLNLHTHRKPQSEKEVLIRNAFFPKKISTISHLPYLLSVGIHPWFAEKIVADFAEKMQALLALKQIVAVGEIGLDRAKNVPFEAQIAVFEAQIALAEQYRKPVILHCVKALSDIFPYLKKTNVPFIFHQFEGNTKQLAQMLPYNAYFSFGKNLFNSPKSQTTFAATPANRYFLETDIAAIRIENVYKQAAFLRGETEAQVIAQIQENWNLVFSHRL